MQLEILLPCQHADLLDITVITFGAQTSNLKLSLTLFHVNKCFPFVWFGQRYAIEFTPLNGHFINFFYLCKIWGVPSGVRVPTGA